MALKIAQLNQENVNRIIEGMIYNIIQEDVLGDNWRETEIDQEDKVLNNYEPFEAEAQEDEEHEASIVGEPTLDPTVYEAKKFSVKLTESELKILLSEMVEKTFKIKINRIKEAKERQLKHALSEENLHKRFLQEARKILS